MSVISQAEEAEQKEGDAALLRQTLRKGLLEREKSGKTTRAAVAVAGWNTQKKGQQWTLLCKSCCRKFGSWNLEVMSDVGQREQADRICKEAVKKRMRAVSPKFVLESRRKRYCISDDQVEEQAIEQKKRLVELLDPADVFAPEKTTGRVERMEFISGESGMEVVGGNESDGQEEQILRLSAQESFEETRSALVATKSVPARRETTLLPIKTFDPVLQHRFFCPWRKQFTSLLRQQLEIREETSLLSPNQDVRDLVKSSLSSVRMLYFSSVASKDL